MHFSPDQDQQFMTSDVVRFVSPETPPLAVTTSPAQSSLSSCLHLLRHFIAQNFVGGETCAFHVERSGGDSPGNNDYELIVDTVEPSKCAKDLHLLQQASEQVEKIENCSSPLRCLMKARVSLLHQKCLPERSKTLYDKMFENYELFCKSDEFEGLNSSDKAVFLCELLHARLEYREVSKAMEILPRILTLTKIEPRVFGALGKRTRFQEKLVAQLGVQVVSTAENGDGARQTIDSSVDDLPTSTMPQNVALTDDTLLNSTYYAENVDETGRQNIHTACEHLALWAVISVREVSEARDPLLEEEVFRFLDLVLRSPSIWLVHRGALLLRSRWEKRARRKVERALAQVESILTEFRSEKDEECLRRADFAFAAGLEPWWSVEQLMASILSSLGCVKESLEVYNRIGDIPNLIECYRSLGRLDRAEKIIRDELAVKKTPQMLTYLGDVTNNPEYYDEAWTLSSGRYGKAQKHLGMLHLQRHSLELALDAFTKSVRSLAVTDQPWYNIGYCAMKLERFDVAAKAFRRCVDIEPDSFDAWNNLAAAYTHMKETKKAFHIIQEALKADFENWKIWDNFLTLAVETRHWNEAVRALHKLLDLNQTKMDGQLLQAMAANCGVEELQNLREVLARITATHASSGAWFAYGTAIERTLNEAGESVNQDIEKMTKAYQRSFAMLLQENLDWVASEESVLSTLHRAVYLLRKYDDLRGAHPSFNWSQAVASLRMSVKSAVATVKKRYDAECPLSISNEIDAVHQCISKLSEGNVSSS